MKTAALFALLTTLTPAIVSADPPPSLPRVTLSGSTTMMPLINDFGEVLKKEVVTSMAGGGSGIGFTDLRAGQAHIACSSRAMKPEEKEAIEKGGRKVTEVIIGYDALAFCVHSDNPVKSASIDQLRGVWIRDGKNRQWSDLGNGLPANLIDLYGRETTSAVAGALPVLLKSDKRVLHSDIRKCADAAEITGNVAKEPHSMGCLRFAEISDKMKVKVLPVSSTAEAAPVTLSAETVADGTWPLTQPLYLYTTSPDNSGVKIFIAFAQSKAGREILTKGGFVAPKETKK